MNLYTFEIDENVKVIKQLDFSHGRTYVTVELDENVKREKTVEFVTLLNVWDCWMRYECEIR